MERRSQQLGGVLLLSMGLVSGGASASQANAASDGIDSGAVVEMVVINRTPGTVTAYVEWRGAGGRVPLGEVRGRQTRIFVTPHRDLEFRLSLNVLSTPPVLTGAATRRREPTQSFVTVYPGERYEWEIRQTYPTIELFYLRVPRTSRLAGDMIRARAVIPAAAPGSRPSAGDLLRVECFSPQAQDAIAEGFFEGAGGGELLLSVGLQSQRVAVPVVNVTRVEVRRPRSRSREGGLIGALLGAAAGAVIGDSNYERESSLHLRREIYGIAGGIAGALGGLALGAGIGSFINTDVWLEVPQNWVVQYSESGSTTPEDSARAMGCLSPVTDTR